jgi:hypothetical protein
MGRTIPSFRIALEMEREEWKPFRNALDKSDRKKFDDMWDIPRWYVSACSNSVQYVRLHPILMSILLYDYKDLTQCISEVERLLILSLCSKAYVVFLSYKRRIMKETYPITEIMKKICQARFHGATSVTNSSIRRET